MWVLLAYEVLKEIQVQEDHPVFLDPPVFKDHLALMEQRASEVCRERVVPQDFLGSQVKNYIMINHIYLYTVQLREMITTIH